MKLKRFHWALLILLVILFSIIPVTKVFAGAPKGGSGKIIIGIGNLEDNSFTVNDVKYLILEKPTSSKNGKVGIYSVEKDIKSFTFKKTVTYKKKNYDIVEIRSYSFQDCTKLKSITIPEYIREIFPYSFTGCTALKSVAIKCDVTSLLGETFKDCTSLQTVNIEGSIKYITISDFENCTSLESVTLPKSLKEIGMFAFANCTSLKNITLPKGLEKVGESAFSGCTKLGKVEFKSNTDLTVDYDAFKDTPYLTDDKDEFNVLGNCLIRYNRDQEEVTLPSSVKSLYNGFLGDGSAVKKIIIPDKTLKEISTEAFAYNNTLEEVILPKGLTYIDVSAFQECTALKEIRIPDDVITIEANAFLGCTSLEKVTLSKKLGYLGDFSFAICTSLDNVSIPDAVKELPTTFAGCTNLKTVKLPKNIIILGGTFYGCTSLKEIELPKGLQDIANFNSLDAQVGLGAFTHCTSLENISIPAGTDITGNSFTGCTSLKTITFQSDKNSKKRKLAQAAFENLPALEEVFLPNHISSIENGTFDDSPNLTIHCNKDSAAHKFAKKYGINFMLN